MKQALLDVQHLSKSYNGQGVFNDFKFSLLAGQCVLLQGENGSGKTTILKILAGLTEPDQGIFTLGDNDPGGYKNVYKQLRNLSIYMHQQPYLFSASVKKNLHYSPSAQSMLTENEVHRINKLLHLDALQNENASNLSVGQKQRVALARSVLINPSLLLLDEPFTALDKSSHQYAAQVLADFKNKNGTILLVSHQHDRSFELVDECWCIDPGGILFCV